MSYIQIGSAALNKHYEFLNIIPEREKGLDIDYIADFDTAIYLLKALNCKKIQTVDDGKKLIGYNAHFPVEIEIAWAGSTAKELLDWCKNTTAESDVKYRTIAPLDALYSLKMSHRYKRNSPHFLKTMGDISAMKRLGAVIPDSLSDWFKRREKETYDYSHPNLNTTKKQFFNPESVFYQYDHDSIHLAIKVDERPAYDYFKPNVNEVFCSKEMFWACSEDTRRNAVYEESAVLAIERSLVPFPDKKSPLEAFDLALEKVCTSITSGWFREYAYNNYHHVKNFSRLEETWGRGFFDKFKRGLENGVVKPFSN